MIRQECFLLVKGESPHITKDIEMKRFLAFVTDFGTWRVHHRLR